MSWGFAIEALIGPAGATGTGFTTDRARLDPELGQPLSASGTFPQYNKTDGTNFPISLLGYDDTADDAIFFKFFPSTYGSGNLTLLIEWYSATGQVTGDVVWSAQIACITPGDAQSVETKAFAAAQTATTTVNGTARGMTQTSITISNLDSIAAGDLVWIKVQRTGSAGGDTMTGDANLMFATVSWSTT